MGGASRERGAFDTRARAQGGAVDEDGVHGDARAEARGLASSGEIMGKRAALLADLEAAENPRAFWEDVLWAILNSREFLFQR